MSERPREQYVTLDQADYIVLLSELARARELATKNAVTGLPNINGLQEYMSRVRSEYERNGRQDQHVVAIYGDLKGFKKINEQFTDQGGNEILRAVGEMLLRIHRPEDFVGNLFGDSYFMVLQVKSEKRAKKVISVAERKIQNELKTLSIPLRDKEERERLIKPQMRLNHAVISINDDFEAVLRRVAKNKFESARSG